MVDEIRDVMHTPLDPSAAGPDPEAAEEEKKKEARAKELISKHRVNRKAQKGHKAKDDRDQAFSRFAKQIQMLKNMRGDDWNPSVVRGLKKMVKDAVSEKTAALVAADKADAYAVDNTANALREQMRKMMNSLNPPPEIAEGDDMMELMELLWPSSMRRKGSSKFDKGSSIKGSVKKEVMDKLVNDAVQEASRRAGKKMLQQQKHQSDQMNKFAKMSLDQLARAVKRKKKKIAKGKVVDENGELVDMDEEERKREDRELQEMMELFSQKALETMKVLREEIAPTWAPEQQPWLLQEADKQVYDILLATADKSILEETQAWENIQNLRGGDAVFTLRAHDKLTEAASRRGSS